MAMEGTGSLVLAVKAVNVIANIVISIFIWFPSVVVQRVTHAALMMHAAGAHGQRTVRQGRSHETACIAARPWPSSPKAFRHIEALQVRAKLEGDRPSSG
jgi:hypothetical protein